MPKFRRATPPNSEVISANLLHFKPIFDPPLKKVVISKVISANLLHFKPIFDPPLKKVVRGAAVPGGKCASKTWSFSSACKNLGAQHPLGAEIWFSEKCDLG